MHQLAQQMGAALAHAGYDFAISETHHHLQARQPLRHRSLPRRLKRHRQRVRQQAANQQGTHPLEALRERDAPGLHVLTATSGSDRITLSHESFNRRGFAEGAVRAAEWLSTRRGSHDFRDIFPPALAEQRFSGASGKAKPRPKPGLFVVWAG